MPWESFLDNKEQLKLAVDTMCAAEEEDYRAMVRTLKMLHLLPLHCSIDEYPELNAVLALDEERFAVFLQIVATRRDKARTSPQKKMRREYMREYMRKKRRANAKVTTARRRAVPSQG